MKKAGIGLLGLVLFCVAAIGFVFQFVLTPEKITPKVVQALNENLDAQLHLDAIELTFFKTFPSFKLELRNGYVLNQNAGLDSTVVPSPNDTLIRFDRALVSVNPLAFLRDKIKVKQFLFENPRIYAYISPDGDPNWNILKESTPEPETDSIAKEEEGQKEFSASIDLQDIRIINGKLTFDDRYTENYFTTSGFDLELSARYNPEQILLHLVTDTEHIVFRKQDKTFTDNISLQLTSDFEVDRKAKTINLERTSVGLNDIVMEASGTLQPDKAKKEVDVELVMELEVPTLNTLIDLVPETLFDKSEKYAASGDVELRAEVNGIYKKGQLPEIKANLSIENGSLSYNSKPNQIEKIELKADVFLPSDKGVQSSFNLHEFQVVAIGTDLSARGYGRDLYGKAEMDLEFNGNLDLDAVQNSLPLKKQVQLGGKAEMDVKTNFSLRDLDKQDYGRIQALGKLRVEGMHYQHPEDSTVLRLELLDLLTGQEQNSQLLTEKGQRVLGGKIEVKNFQLTRGKALEARSDQFKASFASTPWKDSSMVTTAKASIVANNIKLFLGDSIRAILRNLDGEFHLSPQASDPKNPELRSTFQLDSLGILAKGKKIGLEKGAYDLSSARTGDKRWPLKGHISFERMLAFMPGFPLWLKMPETRVEMAPGQISLSKAKMEIGKSDLTATGRIYNFGDAFFRDGMFKGELEVYSSLIDVNEMIAAMNEGAEWRQSQAPGSTREATAPADSTAAKAPRSFVVPGNLDLRFESMFDRVLYKKYAIDKVAGLITVKDQKISLSALQMVTMAAKMSTTVNYSSPEKGKADLDFDFKLLDIDLAQLTDLFPVLDSLLPMADSFEGNVNFRMQGAAKLDKNMGMVGPSLDAIARVEGDNLVVLDGKTFQRISKILLFKNKEKNTIDKLEFAMIFKDSYIEIFPSLITVDRYKVALGGQHKMDMTYDYHLSILKSPVPFKAGIDIIGTDDDLDLKITKAKYKRLFSTRERQRKKADSTVIIRKNNIIRRLPF